MSSFRSIAFAACLVGLLVAPVAAQSPSPSPLPAASAAPSIPAAACTAPQGCPLHTIGELLAPPEAPVDVDAVLARYEPTRYESVVVLDLKTPCCGPMDEVRDIDAPIHSEIGAAAHLCAHGSARESATERVFDRQRGCLLAIEGEWGRYLAAGDGPEAEERFTAARALHGLADEVLGTRDRAWLDLVLARTLPISAAEVPPPYDGARVGEATLDEVLVRRPGRVNGAALLRAIRDAQAADVSYLGPATADIAADDSFYSPAAVGWLAPYLAKDRLVHVSVPGMCLHDVGYLQKVKKSWDVSGISLLLDRPYACWQVVGAMWHGYQATGSEAYLRAARLAWAQLARIDPATAAYAARTHRFNREDQKLR